MPYYYPLRKNYASLKLTLGHTRDQAIIINAIPTINTTDGIPKY